MSTEKKLYFGAAIVVVVLAIWYLQSMKVQPGGGASGTANGGTLEAGGVNDSNASDAVKALAAADVKAGYAPAHEILDPTGFVNASSSFTLGNFIGKKVILLDFWTYSCINCIRSLPHLAAWYQKYAPDGLEIVGMHTPEFDFEKDITNVQAAVKNFGITYPVILDSNYSTWNEYGNLYWPEEYLIDMAGYVVHRAIGEGDYDTTEKNIQTLLAQRASILGVAPPADTTSTTAVPNTVNANVGSPETYFGAARNEFLANGNAGVQGVQTIKDPSSIAPNELYLSGAWNFQDQYAQTVSAGAKVFYHYRAAKVFFVGSAPAGATVEVLQDGKPVTAAAAGADVHDGKVTIGASRLYSIINNPGGTEEHVLELIIDQPSLQAFTFTFG